MLRKILNYTKSSWIIFYAKNISIFPLYVLLAIHFGRRVSTYFGLEVSGQFEICKQKISNIHKE